MSNIIEEYRQQSINNLKRLYNSYFSRIINNYNNEIRSINRQFRMPFNQKKILINNTQKKYDQIIKSLKTNLDNQMKNIIEVNAVESTNEISQKKALLIGINYNNTSSQLRGCINDAKSIEQFLKTKNFSDIKFLTDDTEIKPTRFNILNEIKNILQTSNKNDSIFIFYSGHGSYTIDRNGDELDGRDELLVPLDFKYIVDDELKSLIDAYGKPDTNVVALFDCCNSGTALDLKYQLFENLNYDNITDNPANTETSCNILLLSGCRDEQLSFETVIDNKVQGLMTRAFLDTIGSNNDITWRNLLKQMREKLKTQSYQIPQLSSGKLFNPDNKVLL